MGCSSSKEVEATNVPGVVINASGRIVASDLRPSAPSSTAPAAKAPAVAAAAPVLRPAPSKRDVGLSDAVVAELAAIAEQVIVHATPVSSPKTEPKLVKPVVVVRATDGVSETSAVTSTASMVNAADGTAGATVEREVPLATAAATVLAAPVKKSDGPDDPQQKVVSAPAEHSQAASASAKAAENVVAATGLPAVAESLKVAAVVASPFATAAAAEPRPAAATVAPKAVSAAAVPAQAETVPVAPAPSTAAAALDDVAHATDAVTAVEAVAVSVREASPAAVPAPQPQVIATPAQAAVAKVATPAASVAAAPAVSSPETRVEPKPAAIAQHPAVVVAAVSSSVPKAETSTAVVEPGAAAAVPAPVAVAAPPQPPPAAPAVEAAAAAAPVIVEAAIELPSPSPTAPKPVAASSPQPVKRSSSGGDEDAARTPRGSPSNTAATSTATGTPVSQPPQSSPKPTSSSSSGLSSSPGSSLSPETKSKGLKALLARPDAVRLAMGKLDETARKAVDRSHVISVVVARRLKRGDKQFLMEKLRTQMPPGAIPALSSGEQADSNSNSSRSAGGSSDKGRKATFEPTPVDSTSTAPASGSANSNSNADKAQQQQAVYDLPSLPSLFVSMMVSNGIAHLIGELNTMCREKAAEEEHKQLAAQQSQQQQGQKQKKSDATGAAAAVPPPPPPPPPAAASASTSAPVSLEAALPSALFKLKEKMTEPAVAADFVRAGDAATLYSILCVFPATTVLASTPNGTNSTIVGSSSNGRDGSSTITNLVTSSLLRQLNSTGVSMENITDFLLFRDTMQLEMQNTVSTHFRDAVAEPFAAAAASAASAGGAGAAAAPATAAAAAMRASILEASLSPILNSLALSESARTNVYRVAQSTLEKVLHSLDPVVSPHIARPEDRTRIIVSGCTDVAFQEEIKTIIDAAARRLAINMITGLRPFEDTFHASLSAISPASKDATETLNSLLNGSRASLDGVLAAKLGMEFMKRPAAPPAATTGAAAASTDGDAAPQAQKQQPEEASTDIYLLPIPRTTTAVPVDGADGTPSSSAAGSTSSADGVDVEGLVARQTQEYHVIPPHVVETAMHIRNLVAGAVQDNIWASCMEAAAKTAEAIQGLDVFGTGKGAAATAGKSGQGKSFAAASAAAAGGNVSGGASSSGDAAASAGGSKTSSKGGKGKKK